MWLMYRDSSLQWNINFLLDGGNDARLYCTVKDLALWEGRPTLSPNTMEYSSRRLRNPVTIEILKKEEGDRLTLICPFKDFDAQGKYQFNLDREFYMAYVEFRSSDLFRPWEVNRGSITRYDLYPADLAGLSKILYCATIRPRD